MITLSLWKNHELDDLCQKISFLEDILSQETEMVAAFEMEMFIQKENSITQKKKEVAA